MHIAGRLIAVLSMLCWSVPAAADTPVTALDYTQDGHWLCLPSRADLCAADLTTTVVAADGTLRREIFVAAAAPSVDCFYVYPTVSLDPTGNSDTQPGTEERAVILAQFARFAAVCRTFAPLYRQVTLTALRARMLGQPSDADRALAYADVRAAWRHYLAHYNQGRGVVLIGHSQGAGVLTQLIRDEIDGAPFAGQLVSALLIGTTLPLPAGSDFAGAFEHVPFCRAAQQTGCVVSFASFRAAAPPPANSLFGRVRDETGKPLAGFRAACVNPAALLAQLDGQPTPLHAYFSTGMGANLLPLPEVAWTSKNSPIDTPFVSLPGLVSGQCVSDSQGDYLAISVHGDPTDPRVDDIPGDVQVGGTVLANWGLHLVDMHLVMGDLIQLVGVQAAAWSEAR